MKKYWKLITLSAVILFTFMIYYIQPIIAKEEMFELELVTDLDKEDIGKNLTISGDIYEIEHGELDNYGNSIHDPFELSREGMIYLNQLSFFEQLNNLHPHPKMKQLKQDYRSFMRGKDAMELLYEDEEVLAYVGPFGQSPENGTVQLKFSILNKQSREAQKFNIEVPVEIQMQFVNVKDVQIVNEKLYVLASHYGQYNEEYVHHYQIDLEKEIIEESSEVQDLTGGEFELANEYNGIGKKTHYVFKEYENIEETEDGALYDNTSTFVSYHIETGERNEIDIPDEWEAYNDLYESEINPYTLGSFTINEEYMYFLRFEEEKLFVDQYNLLDNKLEATKELTLETGLIEGLNLVAAEGDKAGLISTTSVQGTNDRPIVVIDLMNAEVIYEGDINIKNTSKDLHAYEMDFYQIYLK